MAPYRANDNTDWQDADRSPRSTGEKIMPQGVRGWCIRAMHTGLGVVLCAGAIGCMNTDKDRMPPPKIGANGPKGNSPPPGFPGIQPIPGSTPVGTNTRQAPPGFNTPNPATGMGSVQPAGFATGVGVPQARAGAQPPVQPANFNQPQPIVPSAGPSSFTGTQLPPPNSGYINPQSNAGGPPPVNLDPALLPPAPPGNVTSNSNFAPVTVNPPQPLQPIAPIAPGALVGK